MRVPTAYFYTEENHLAKIIRSFTEKRTKQMKVEDKQKLNLSLGFLFLGNEFLDAARGITNLCYLTPRVVLGHHGIELILKALFVWFKKKTPPLTHDLNTLAEKLEEITFSSEQLHIMSKIKTFFYHRYPDDVSYESISNILLKINDEIIPGVLCEAGELGTDDWDKIESLYNDLLQSLPQELYDEYINRLRSLNHP